ncbi:MAG: hypothetical protein S4CHLAM123_08660 [Chlamydiales bacterium]|nr:hypothetical protein [Chlamydiales bacterium]
MAVQPPQDPERSQKEISSIQEESRSAILLKSKGPRLGKALKKFQSIRPNAFIKITKSYFI